MNKKQTFNVAVTVWISAIVCGLIYYFYPTEIIKPLDTYEIKNLSDAMMVNTWKTGNPNCCLPSGHCMMALGSLLCVYNRKELKWWIRVLVAFSCVMTFGATIFLRQHYILDLVASLILVTLVYTIVCLCKVGDKMVKKFCNGQEFDWSHKDFTPKRKLKKNFVVLKDDVEESVSENTDPAITSSENTEESNEDVKDVVGADTETIDTKNNVEEAEPTEVVEEKVEDKNEDKIDAPKPKKKKQTSNKVKK